MIQREQALFEQRQRIKNASKSMYGVTITHAHVDVTVMVEHKKNNSDTLDLLKIRQKVDDYLNKSVKDGKDFEVIMDEIYEEIAVIYSERDIEVHIFDNNEKFTVSKIYNVSKPFQQLAI